MPSSHSPELIIARYLKSNNYTNTLSAFLQEAGLPPDSATTKAGDWTIEKILEEKRQFDASLRYEKTGDEEGDGVRGWSVKAPNHPTVLTPPSHLANVLCITAVEYPLQEGNGKRDVLMVSLANRELLAVALKRDGGHSCEWKATSTSPILSITSPGIGFSGYITSEMSGKLIKWDDSRIDETARQADTRQDHVKYAVKVITFEHDGLHYTASAGWDQKVYVYCSEGSNNLLPTDPPTTLTFQTNPECLLFAVNPDTNVLHLIVSRRDSTHLMYYSIVPKQSTNPIQIECVYTGRQNLAPHSNAWISFTPFHFLPHPSNSTLIAIATNHTPHMKLLIVRLLFPSITETATPTPPISSTTLTPSTHHAARQAREDLALQHREDAAIILHTTTQAPQTPYSTPQLAWRPDGSGIWVNGDDGVVRGIEVSSGKVVSVLGGAGDKSAAGGEEEESGHEPGSKVRSLWAGNIRFGEEEGEEEVVVSGGFDKRVIVWRAS